MSRARSVPMVLTPTCLDVKKNSVGSQSSYRNSEGLQVPLRKRSCSVHCALCTVQCALCSVQCALCTVQCALCSVPRAPCTVHCECAVSTVHCALCSVHCATPLEIPWERARLYCTNKYAWPRNFSWRSDPGVFLLNLYSSRNPCRPSLPYVS